ncbi:hypothetical protein JGI7_00956 [Candidatus Kryptonium thompsonii]|jgi:hypothetical protein|uniref:Repeat domain-containing protein n=1 Tax=Candidatus Kryptonium thompsonii TaxID=1633631 RepID=A0A0P1LDQ0_9BACT|nr:hypothetical protein [Candidatus Kryptonium thompsoni]CUS78444.1 hypothetical protein JGI14_100419 [Candidatus Kryptonium thompsoni]CUS79774.1 hypothetical protein JGI15_100635 [Candidatus Kryptonium thompsoni]CUS84633.1 hypothetical protein JGI13_01086 [Candidatus Kryptonium thompsoni]CUS85095.1 hypothetical protein JGI6_00130 [Candidatus Kryptonium thompsoni]CUS85881.1 hypothetical protein JGI12_00914 [Candidatus Kryptonium thompsoni]
MKEKLLIFLLISCFNSFSQQKSVKLDLQLLKNAAYYTIFGDTTVKLKNGSFVLEERDKDGFLVNYLSVDLYEEKIAMGDVDGDGDVDAVVILRCSGGGSGTFYEVAVVSNENGKPRYLTGELLGDRIKVNSVKVLQDGSILLDMIVHGPDDPQCCPTVQKVQRYKILDSKLQIMQR